MRKLTETKIVLASHNPGKLNEIQLLLLPFGVKCVSAGDLGIDEPAETESSDGRKYAFLSAVHV